MRQIIGCLLVTSGVILAVTRYAISNLCFISGACGIIYFCRKSCIQSFGSFTSISYSLTINCYFYPTNFAKWLLPYW